MALNEVALFDSLEKITKKLDVALSSLVQKAPGDLKELNAALAAAQGEFKVARPSKENNYWKAKYECLADLVEASRKPLSKNGLSVRFEDAVGPDGTTLLTCILAHSSGQQVASTIRVLPSKNDPRAFVSENEYLKRMLYAGLVGVVADEDDDDAEFAMMDIREEEDRGTSLTTKYNPRENLRVTITPEQLEELNYELAEFSDLAEKVLKQLNLKYLADMPKEKFSDAMKRIREIKNLRKGK